MKLFDSHLHIIDPRFPLIENKGYLPGSFTCDEYLKRMTGYDLCGGAIVSGSFQGLDQTYLLDALEKLGPGYVGVVNLDAQATDQEILDLHDAGIRAVRFNLKRGDSIAIGEFTSLACRVNELCDWHSEFYVDAGDLAEIYEALVNLPSISIDHLGLTKKGFASLLKLVEKGSHVKASGFGRVDFEVTNAIKQIYSINPNALMFGTDLPSTRAPRAYSNEDFKLIVDTFAEDEAKNIFSNNAIAFYNLKSLR